MDKQYFVEFGHGPYANLLVDPTFKKAFDPTHTESRTNLINFLNDILGPQLRSPIENLYVARESLNRSGSKESRSSILDLHCTDMENRHFEVEVQKHSLKNFVKRIGYYASQLIVEQGEPGKDWNYKVNPVYILSILNFELFHDRRAIRRATTLDIETHEQILDSYNYTFIELPKISSEISENSDEVQKWLFVLSNLGKLQKLPPAVSTHKFGRLLIPAKIANFNREELKQYEDAMRLEWDEYAIKQQKLEDQAKYEAEQAQRKEVLAKMDAEQAQRKEVLAKMDAEQAQRKTELAKMDAEQAQRKTELAKMDAEQAQRKTELAKMDAEQAQRKTELAKMDAEQAQRKTELAKMDAEQAQRKTELAKMDAEQAQRKTELAKMDAEQAQRKTELAKMDVEQKRIKEEIVKMKADYERIKTDQAKIDVEQTQMNAEKVKLAKEKAQLQKEKEELLSLKAELERNLKENKRSK